MTSNNSPEPIQPLSIGNVVTAGIKLYRSHLKSYFLLALIGTLWTFLPFVFIIAASIILGLIARAGNNIVLGFGWLSVIVISVVLFFYSLGKWGVNAATISRLAYQELLNQPEIAKTAREQLQPKLWAFVRYILLQGVIFSGIILVLGAVSSILLFITNFNLVVIFAVILVVSIIVLWFFARLFICDTVLAIEDTKSAVTSVDRSWDLTKESMWRVLLIILLALLFTFPLQIIVQIISRYILQSYLQPALIEVNSGSTDKIGLVIFFYFLILGLALFVNVVILPFWQAIKGVIYYDLRNRREGLGLNLRS